MDFPIFDIQGGLCTTLLRRFVEPNQISFSNGSLKIDQLHIALTLGLKVKDDLGYNVEALNRAVSPFCLRNFGEREIVEATDVKEALSKEGVSNEDYVRLKLLLFLPFFLVSNCADEIDVKYIDLADDLDNFNNFHWGKVVCDNLLIGMGRARDGGLDKLFNFYSCPIALQLWAYEDLPACAPPFVGKSYPQIL